MVNSSTANLKFHQTEFVSSLLYFKVTENQSFQGVKFMSTQSPLFHIERVNTNYQLQYIVIECKVKMVKLMNRIQFVS